MTANIDLVNRLQDAVASFSADAISVDDAAVRSDCQEMGSAVRMIQAQLPVPGDLQNREMSAALDGFGTVAADCAAGTANGPDAGLLQSADVALNQATDDLEDFLADEDSTAELEPIPDAAPVHSTGNQAVGAAHHACRAFRGYVVTGRAFPDPPHIDIYAQGAEELVGYIPVRHFERPFSRWVRAGAPRDFASPHVVAIGDECGRVGVTILTTTATTTSAVGSAATSVQSACQDWADFDYGQTSTVMSVRANGIVDQVQQAAATDSSFRRLLADLREWAQDPPYSSNGTDAEIETLCRA